MTKGVSVQMSHFEGLKVFEIKALRSMFGPNKNKIIEGWRKLHNKDLHTLYLLTELSPS
jgi:hypothetical protein